MTLGRPRAAWVGVAAVTALASLAGTLAADSRWLVVMGGEIVSTHGVPDAAPYAAAPSDGWPNVPALAEVLFHALHAIPGDRGLLLAQVVAVAVAGVLLVRDARAGGAGDRGTLLALLVLLPAAFGALVAVRAQLFSLVLFALAVLLLRGERAAPSRRIWLLAPLCAVWSNLHGGVLTGLAVAGVYLLVDRLRREPRVALGVLAASAAALCLTPPLLETPAYYRGVLESQAAKLGIGLWAPLSLHSGVDLAFMAAAVVLVAAALRARPPLWEMVALAGLAVLTARASRGGVFLALFAVPLAARGLGPVAAASRPRLAGPVTFALGVFAVLGALRGPLASGASEAVLHRTLALAAGTPVLAQDALAEQVALAGGRVWIANPLDAFRAEDQRVYVEWLEGRAGGDAALLHAPRAILVRRGSATERRLRARGGVRRVARDARTALYAQQRVSVSVTLDGTSNP